MQSVETLVDTQRDATDVLEIIPLIECGEGDIIAASAAKYGTYRTTGLYSTSKEFCQNHPPNVWAEAIRAKQTGGACSHGRISVTGIRENLLS